MIGSVFVVRMIWLHKLVWHTNDRRRVTRLPTHLFDSGSHGGVCDVPEVPGYQIINAVRSGNRDMCGVIGGVARDGSHLEQLSCEVRRILGRVEERDGLQSIQTGAAAFASPALASLTTSWEATRVNLCGASRHHSRVTAW